MMELALIMLLGLVVGMLTVAFVLYWRGTRVMIADLNNRLDELAAGLAEQQRGIAGLAAAVLANGTTAAADDHDRRTVATETSEAPVFGYDMAARLAAIGASETELVKACGVSAEEAALVARLHGGKHRNPGDPQP